MIRHGPHGLRAQAYQLRPTVPLAVRIRSTAPRVKIRDDGTQLNCEINHRDRTFPASLSPPAAVSAQRWHHQNPKSP
jgi:hypothetical protein